MSQEVVGVLAKIIFENERGDFRVADFIDPQTAKRFRASGKIFLSQKADARQKYRLIGNWENNPKYGESFVAIYSEAARPAEAKGIAPYLANNVKGVGEATALKLVEALNIKNIDMLVRICKEDKEKIYSFFGSKRKKTAENVITSMITDEVFRSVMIFLHEHNIPPKFAKRIYEKYGAHSLNNLKENPYRLIADFRQVGFKRADAIAEKLGVPPTSPFRMEAAFVYTLEVAQDDGHCCLPRDLLIDKARDILGVKINPVFSREFVLDNLRQVYKKNREVKNESFIIRDTTIFKNNQNIENEVLFYLPEVIKMEDDVAGFISSLLNKSIATEYKEQQILKELDAGDKNIDELFPHLPWDKLSDEQQTAVRMSLDSRIMVLTGGPGCGKTFVLKAIYGIQRALNRKVALCAPTGLAAKRMTHSIGEHASTLHKLLGLGRKKEEQVNIIEELEGNTSALDNFNVVIIDESSMLSLDLFHSLLSSLGPNRRLILVGDVDQLPSVGAGNCLRDIIKSNKVPIARLTKIFRQSSESPIPIAAREIISGNKPNFNFVSYSPIFSSPEPIAFIPCSTQTFFDLLQNFLSNTIPNIYELDPVKNVQILVPMRKTEVGQENINKVMQNFLNPSSENKKECSLAFGGILREGDKVIQTKNNYELDVFNGDLGFCKAITKTKDKLEVTIEFSDKTVAYEDEDIDDLQLCYAMTVHKSQGSEFPLCIIPMFGVYYSMLDRNLLYTAVTRASKYIIIFGEEWSIKKAVASQNAIKRHTFLDSLIES
ncbi:ATP-dependent RecD-like DNA helicase [Pigmentibacter sp. JX0631]|uniref:SF1B family DNA helicase RecD2 n=1 Tax=Pigmentibacter sp. JX0631 TaxID=2976982 RepID=UPI002469291B|nr:ATP-dependent RecD-like DNA helicase [Pigmentibacter sp. JX0631]WGL60429.1 ATP-dependent RecD-like DNA helicase [Pigmentibacter sp. JX0631]